MRAVAGAKHLVWRICDPAAQFVLQTGGADWNQAPSFAACGPRGALSAVRHARASFGSAEVRTDDPIEIGRFRLRHCRRSRTRAGAVCRPANADLLGIEGLRIRSSFSEGVAKALFACRGLAVSRLRALHSRRCD